MRTAKTICYKIKNPTKRKERLLRSTAESCRSAGNYALEVCKEVGGGNQNVLHKRTYAFMRNNLGLPAQLAQSARNKAIESFLAYRALKKNGNWNGNCRPHGFPHFDGSPWVRYDKNSMAVKWVDSVPWVSLLTLKGRVHLRLAGNKYMLEQLKKSPLKFAEAIFKNGSLYLHATFFQEVKKPYIAQCKTVIGIDIGVNNLLVAQARTLSGKVLGTTFANGKRAGAKRKFFASYRKSLARRKLLQEIKETKERESNYMKTLNHQISSRLIEFANRFENPCIAMEDLKDIRSKVKYTRRQNRRIHNWNFRQLQDFVKYKALGEHLTVRTLSAAFSSLYCSRCSWRGLGSPTVRNRHTIHCKSCGYRLNADLNGAGNMTYRAARYILAAGGRAGEMTAERKSGPELRHDRNSSPAKRASTAMSDTSYHMTSKASSVRAG